MKLKDYIKKYIKKHQEEQLVIKTTIDIESVGDGIGPGPTKYLVIDILEDALLCRTTEFHGFSAKITAIRIDQIVSI